MFQFDPKDGVVTRLLRAGLTNNPNLHLTAIAASRTAAAHNQTKDEQMEFPTQELRELLNLDAEATVATNLLGPIRLTNALLPHLRRQPRSTIVTGLAKANGSTRVWARQ